MGRDAALGPAAALTREGLCKSFQAPSYQLTLHIPSRLCPPRPGDAPRSSGPARGLPQVLGEPCSPWRAGPPPTAALAARPARDPQSREGRWPPWLVVAPSERGHKGQAAWRCQEPRSWPETQV